MKGKINRQNKIIHLEILLKNQYRDKIVSPEYRSCIYLLSVNTDNNPNYI